MPLESLNNEQINIHDLALEQEKKPDSEIKKDYEELKKTALYDENENLWHSFMEPNQELNSKFLKRYETDSQLLSVVIENMFDPTTADDHYSQLKNSLFYNADNNTWNQALDGSSVVLRGKKQVVQFSRGITDQLLGIWIESNYDKQKAKQKFQEISEKYIDKSTGLWHSAIDHIGTEETKRSMNASFYAEDQLLAVITQYQFDPESANKRYDQLKHKPFARSENLFWNRTTMWDYEWGEVRDVEPQNLHTETELMLVIARSLFEPEEAKKTFEALKKTILYDKKLDQWNQAADTHSRTSSDQFLGLLAEHYTSEKKLILPSSPPLPEERKF